MRVAIEAAPLALTSGGLARYTSQLSLALAHCFPDDEFYLTSDQLFEMPLHAPPNLRKGGGPRNAIERRWWLWGLPREMSRLHADLVHGPDFAVPYLSRRPSVMTLHDLSPWMDERWHHAAQRVKRRTPVLFDLGLATMVITPAESVRKAAIERFRLRPERVVAVPEAAPDWMRPVPAVAVQASPWPAPMPDAPPQRSRDREGAVEGARDFEATPRLPERNRDRKGAAEAAGIVDAAGQRLFRGAALSPQDIGTDESIGASTPRFGGAVDDSASSPRPYFLFVGTVEPRKNLPALIDAWRDVHRDHDIDLVIAGRRRPDAPELRNEPGLRVLGEVPDAELPALYSGALAFVYPSLYEGFGLPVLEAMQCGAPVIASTAVAEAAGSAALFADDTAALARAMRDLIAHPDLPAQLRERSLRRAAEFSWPRTARATHEVYEEARRRYARRADAVP